MQDKNLIGQVHQVRHDDGDNMAVEHASGQNNMQTRLIARTDGAQNDADHGGRQKLGLARPTSATSMREYSKRGPALGPTPGGDVQQQL